MISFVSLLACAAATSAQAKLEDDPNKVMFAAVTKGHGKGKIIGMLGVKRMKQICDELDQGGDFKCDKIFGTGASGTLIGGNNKEWLPEELKRIVKKAELGEATALDWGVAEDETLIPAIGKRKEGSKKKAVHSTFAIEQSLNLFGSSGGGSRYRNRKLISPQDIIDTAAVAAGGPKTIQHDAPLPLGSLSSFAGGCEKRCNDPKSFHYTATGKDVTVYIVDGTVTDHEEFKDMATGVSRVSEDRHYSASAKANEGQTCAGDHGTHVGALVAGFENGPAKDAEIVSVAVQPGCGMAGQASELEEGLDWVLDRHLAQPEPRKRAVVSMSLLVKAQTAAAELIAQKVEELLDAGIVVVAAAGNYHEDACDFVPAGLPGVITVAAADITHDATKAFPWSWSNYGQCVDIWAPGVEIESASPDCFECTAIYSGTSQATPLVSGLIASHLSVNAADDPDAVKKALQDNAAVNVLEVLGHPYDTTVNFFAQTTMV